MARFCFWLGIAVTSTAVVFDLAVGIYWLAVVIAPLVVGLVMAQLWLDRERRRADRWLAGNRAAAPFN